MTIAFVVDDDGEPVLDAHGQQIFVDLSDLVITIYGELGEEIASVIQDGSGKLIVRKKKRNRFLDWIKGLFS